MLTENGIGGVVGAPRNFNTSRASLPPTKAHFGALEHIRVQKKSKRKNKRSKGNSLNRKDMPYARPILSNPKIES